MYTKKIPLSSAQLRIWLEWQLNPDSLAYNNPLLYKMTGALNKNALMYALQQIVNEQPALRCYFTSTVNRPEQVLVSNYDMILDYQDVSSLEEPVKSQVIADCMDHNAHKPFDLSHLPLFRFSLIKTQSTEYLLLLNIHHIVVDGLSAQLLLQSISRYYAQYVPGQICQVQVLDDLYIQYLKQQTDNTDDAKENQRMLFWQQELHNASFRVDLYQKNSTTLLREGRRNYFHLPVTLTKQLKQLARQYKTTDFMLLMSAFSIIIARYAGQQDITIGYPMDIRPGFCNTLFGFFINNIPLRLAVNNDKTLGMLIDDMHQARKRMKPYKETDLLDILRYMRLKQDNFSGSLYNISFTRANFALEGLALGDTHITSELIGTGHVKEDLCLLYDEKDNFSFALEYDACRFDDRYVAQIQQAFIDLLQQLPILRATQILADISLYNTTLFKLPEVPITEDLSGRFLRHVRIQPEKMALLSTEENLSYADLQAAFMGWKSRFVRHLSRQQPVIVCLSRKPALLSILLALQSLKITYIPLSNTLSTDRIKIILADSQAQAIIFEERDNPGFESLPVLAFPIDNSQKLDALPIVEPEEINNNIVYIIYTSGSTGKPKGVAVNFEAFHNVLAAMSAFFMRGNADILLAITTLSFDIAHLELFLPLWQGNTVFLANDTQHKDPFSLKAILENFLITHLQATPAMWQMLESSLWAGKTNLIALCGGENLSRKLADTLLGKTAELWNLYGPTEATIWCSLQKIMHDSDITIGKAIQNMQILVLDEQQRPLPPYVKGELYIAGVGLAEGYINNSSLTAKQFITSSIGRLYKTGDIACTTFEQETILFGRNDNQIKLHGYRIELGDIESVIARLPHIQQSVALLHHQQILAFVCQDSAEIYTETSLLAALTGLLPDYMLPARCIFLQSMPLTPSGKVDKKLLLSSETDITDQPFTLPAHFYEYKLLDIWKTILQQKNISTSAHFYSLGGHSLLAVQLLLAINEQFQTHFSLAQILSAPTIRQQAWLLDNHTLPVSMPIMLTNKTRVALSDTQTNIWFALQLQGDKGQYNMAACMRIKGACNLERIKQALLAISQRHAMLRAFLYKENHQPQQQIAPEIYPEITMATDLDWQAWAAAPFDLFKSPLWRVVVVQSAPDYCEIGMAFHHLIADGYSVSCLLSDLFQTYDSLTTLPELPCQFIDYVIYAKNIVEKPDDIAYWRSELKDICYLELPSSPAPDNAKIIYHAATFPATLWSDLRRFCESFQLSVGSVLCAGFGLLMQQYSGQNNFCIGIPVANREHAALKEMVGCLMDLMPLKIENAASLSSLKWIHRIQARMKNALSHNSLSFSSLLRHVEHIRDNLAFPLFPVLLNIQTDPFAKNWSRELTVDIVPIPAQMFKQDLSVDIYITDTAPRLIFEGNPQRFSLSQIKNMQQDLEIILQNFLQYPDEILSLESTSVVTQNVHAEHRYIVPQTALQKQVATIWGKILGISHIGLQDNFFRKGGQSLLAAALIAELSAVLHRQISLELLFKSATLADFCTAIDALPEQKSIIQSTCSTELPLTPNQRQMVFSTLNGENNLIAVQLIFPEALDKVRLHSAFIQVLQQHSIFQWQLMQDNQHAEFSSDWTFQLDENDGIPDMNMYQAPLIKACMKNYILTVYLHHLIGDEWSLYHLIKIIMQYYFSNTPNLRSQWEAHLSSWVSPAETALDYWKNYLASQPVPSRIAPCLPQTNCRKAARVSYLIKPEIIRKNTHLAQQQGAALYHLTLALFSYMLHVLTDEESVTFVTTDARRNCPEKQLLQGYLVNMIPVHALIKQQVVFNDLLQSIKTHHQAALATSDVDFALLMENGWISSPEIVFNYQHNLDMGTVSWQPLESDQAKFPLIFHLRHQTDGTMLVTLEYRLSLYSEQFINNIARFFIFLLEKLPDQENLPLHTWRLQENLPVAVIDNHQVEKSFFWTALQNRSRNHLQQTALQYCGESYSFERLWQDIDQLAKKIPDCYPDNDRYPTIIALRISHKYEYLVCILAVLRTGASFLAIDAQLPIARQHFLIEDSKTNCVIVDTFLENETADVRFYLLQDVLSKPATDNVIQDNFSDNLPAYCIYTSGTTGNPKGVIIKRSALLQFLQALQGRLSLTYEDRILQFSSVSFDASIWEIFISLYTGATLCCPNEQERRVGKPLENFIRTHNVTHTILTPVVLNTLNPDWLPSLKTVVSGGESCSENLRLCWSINKDFYNAYGPTEATICVSMGAFSTNTRANYLGTALGEAHFRVVNEQGQDLPPGATGELLIGGSILAEGYLHQPALTQKHFIEIDNQRFYKTGDRVRRISETELEYLQRTDRQVKLRGLRIELQEIDMALTAIPGIRLAVCVVEEEQIIALVVMNQPLSEAVILQQLKKRLPAWLLPSTIIFLENPELLISGKLDIQKLLSHQRKPDAHQAPQNSTEEQVHAIWCQILNLPAIDREQDFFALGGNSLQAMSITVELENAFSLECPLQLFYTHGHIAAQSSYLTERIQFLQENSSCGEIIA